MALVKSVGVETISLKDSIARLKRALSPTETEEIFPAQKADDAASKFPKRKKFVPSNADLVVFEAIKSAPAATQVHAARWYKHISSYSAAEKSAFTGEKKALSAYGPTKAVKKEAAADDENDIDLFGSDDEVDEEAERLKEERLAAYREKKAAKPKIAAKSSIVLDVKPWDDETDMKALEAGVRAITIDGLLWGASKLVAIGYGIKKLQIQCVVEDDKVSTDDLEEQIMALEDYCQSMDVAAFQKI